MELCGLLVGPHQLPTGQATDILEADDLFTLSALKDSSEIDAVFDVDLETAGVCAVECPLPACNRTRALPSLTMCLACRPACRPADGGWGCL
jgi:hypothetical protein